MPIGRPRVLVVDDDGPLRRVLHRLLGPLYDIIDVATAEDACALIRDGARFDAILCDVYLDGMSGIEFRACLEHIEREQARRLLLHTGRAQTLADADLLAEAGARSAVVIKPAQVSQFVAAFDTLVEQYGRVGSSA